MLRFSILAFLLISPIVFQARAQEKSSPEDRLEQLAATIQKGDAKAALALFSPQTPGFTEIKRNVEALSVLPDTNCSIEIVGTKLANDSVQFETDWSLHTYSRQNGPMLERRERVVIELRRVGDLWQIVSFSPASVLAVPDPSVFSRIAKLAADLNGKDESGALGAFDSQMKTYGEIDNDIDALMTQNDLLCAIDIVSDRQTGDIHNLELDWYFEIKSRADGGSARQRRETVHVELKQIKGKWKIDRFEPLTILSPVTAQ